MLSSLGVPPTSLSIRLLSSLFISSYLSLALYPSLLSFFFILFSFQLFSIQLLLILLLFLLLL